MSKILLLEKESKIINQVAQLMANNGFDFTAIQQTSQLFSQLTIDNFDILLADLDALGAEYLNILRKIKSHPAFHSVDVVILTNGQTDEVLAKCLEAGTRDFITKPIRNLVMDIRINSIITSRKYVEEFQAKRSLLENKTKSLTTISDQLRKQKSDLQQVNKSIINSIQYAQHIQSAILPSPDEIKKSLPDSFIFFKPRDIVSGDFYWFKEVGDKVVVAAIDCTGHGVPGAFLAVLGDSILSRIIHYHRILHADEILNEIHLSIQRTLRQNETRNYDGMDMALCVIDKQKKTLEFAGAHNPLIFIRDGELQQIKGDKVAVGGAQWDWENGPRVFKKNEIDFSDSKDLYIYMFSDGYQDQFGGKNLKKFQRKRFRQLLFDIHALPMSEQKAKLNDTLVNWIDEGNQEQVDDILVIGVKL
ncbi:hypothetical protein BKI52_21895 [marine bacterium AO1-C]|nr:hypothetical protein BKI52_21895 [marine bacterium AO1-C]